MVKKIIGKTHAFRKAAEKHDLAGRGQFLAFQVCEWRSRNDFGSCSGLSSPLCYNTASLGPGFGLYYYAATCMEERVWTQLIFKMPCSFLKRNWRNTAGFLTVSFRPLATWNSSPSVARSQNVHGGVSNKIKITFSRFLFPATLDHIWLMDCIYFKGVIAHMLHILRHCAHGRKKAHYEFWTTAGN